MGQDRSSLLGWEKSYWTEQVFTEEGRVRLGHDRSSFLGGRSQTGQDRSSLLMREESDLDRTGRLYWGGRSQTGQNRSLLRRAESDWDMTGRLFWEGEVKLDRTGHPY